MNNTHVKKSNNSIEFCDYNLTPEEDDKFMSNIDMDALERGVRKSEEEIASGQGIDFMSAIKKIHKEVFGEEL